MNSETNCSTNKADAWAAAFEGAYRLHVTAVVRGLVDLLGSKALARLGGVSTTRSVYQWLSGDREPERQDTMYFAFQLIAAMRAMGEPDRAIAAWFAGLNPRLHDEAPLDLLARQPMESRQAIVAAARAFVLGGAQNE